MRTFSIKNFWSVLKEAGRNFTEDKVPKLSASLAYYTIFSVGPMLLVIIYLANVFYGREAVEGRLFGQIRNLIGDSGAIAIQEIIKSAHVGSGGTFTVVISFITLFIAATSVFAEIQDTINTIWKLSVRPDAGWLKMLRTRLISFSFVISLGFLLLVSLFINSLIEGLMERLQAIFPAMTVILVYIVNLLITFLLIALLFATIFKVLPDAVIHWKDVSVGALFTALLFMIGKFGITLYLRKTNVGSTYGTAGSLVILILWVYYSSIILYFGAEFTKAYAVKFGSKIIPNEYAVTIQVVKVETGKDSVQENEQSIKATENNKN